MKKYEEEDIIKLFDAPRNRPVSTSEVSNRRDRAKSRALWEIGDLTRRYYYNYIERAEDIIDRIESVLQAVGMGGITTQYDIEVRTENDVGDVMVSKGDSSYGKLGLAGIRRLGPALRYASYMEEDNDNS